MSKLVLDGVSRRFGRVTAVDSFSLALAQGEFISLLGPSGCRETTIVRLIAAPKNLWPREPPFRHRAAIATAWLEISLHESRNLMRLLAFRTVWRAGGTQNPPGARKARGTGEWLDSQPGTAPQIFPCVTRPVLLGCR